MRQPPLDFHIPLPMIHPHAAIRRTLQRDLKGLVSKGLIEESAAAPTDPNHADRPTAL